MNNTTLQTEQKKQMIQQSKVIAIANDSRQVDFDGDRYYLQGIDTTRFLKNPVLFLNHKRDKLPIGRINKIWIQENELMIEFEIYISDIDSKHAQLCLTIQDMIDKGFLKGVSITTRDIEAYPNDFGGFDIFRSELIEISICGVSNNENSLVQNK